jgi:hypothetical protein
VVASDTSFTYFGTTKGFFGVRALNGVWTFFGCIRLKVEFKELYQEKGYPCLGFECN